MGVKDLTTMNPTQVILPLFRLKLLVSFTHYFLVITLYYYYYQWWNIYLLLFIKKTLSVKKNLNYGLHKWLNIKQKTLKSTMTRADDPQ